MEDLLTDLEQALKVCVWGVGWVGVHMICLHLCCHVFISFDVAVFSGDIAIVCAFFGTMVLWKLILFYSVGKVTLSTKTE